MTNAITAITITVDAAYFQNFLCVGILLDKAVIQILRYCRSSYQKLESAVDMIAAGFRRGTVRR